jgi:hypothetical protein
MPAVRAKKDAKSVSPTSCDANPNESITAENSTSQRNRVEPLLVLSVEIVDLSCGNLRVVMLVEPERFDASGRI